MWTPMTFRINTSRANLPISWSKTSQPIHFLDSYFDACGIFVVFVCQPRFSCILQVIDFIGIQLLYLQAEATDTEILREMKKLVQ